MLTTSETSTDYLKVPCHETLVHHKPRRNSLFDAEQSNQLDERIASNLSLPSSTHSIIKYSNSSRQRQSNSSRLTVHYPAIIDDEQDIIPSSMPPTKQNRRKSSSNIDEFFSKPPHQYGLCRLFRKSRQSNPFAYRR